MYLITGGHDLLGSHVARRLYEEGKYRVRVADIFSKPFLPGSHYHEFMLGDLRNPAFCEIIVHGVHSVLHFAANTGGMGTIHDENDFLLYDDNHRMTFNLLRASLAADVKCFFNFPIP